MREARALIAVEAAAYAAPIITEEAIAELRGFTEIISGKAEGLTCIEAHAAFHNKIATVTNNNVIIWVMESVWKMGTEVSQLKNIFRHDGIHAREEYASVIEAFRNRNPVTARKAMRSHFTTVIEKLLLSSEEKAYEEVKRTAFQNRSRYLLST